MDRNTEKWPYSDFHNLSLSARRAWIEMVIDFPLDKFDAVALRKESVDRNNAEKFLMSCSVTSLSARRAWIEIILFVNLRVLDGSLSARRAWIEMFMYPSQCRTLASRSPQGERG